MDHSTHIPSSPGSGWSRGKIVLIAFLAIAGFYLLAEHRAHAFAVLPFLLLPACLLMHVFMHGGHGGHGGTAARRPEHPNQLKSPPRRRLRSETMQKG